MHMLRREIQVQRQMLLIDFGLANLDRVSEQHMRIDELETELHLSLC